MKEVFHKLAPNNKTPQPEQYDLAWRLLGDEKASPIDRANAKCWLTYRAVDGDITINDWYRCVDSAELPEIPKGPFFYRWESSQKTAEVYLHLLQGEIEHYSIAKAELLQDFKNKPVLENWHQSALNLLRVKCLDIYEKYLCDEEAKDSAIAAIEEWWGLWTGSAKKNRVLTYSEMNDGYQAVKVLAHILQKYGVTKIKKNANESPYTLLRPDSNLPFCRSMYWLGWFNRSKAIWVPPARKEGSKVQQYRIIHASKEYGKGGDFKKWLPFIQSEIDAANVRSVIDYGCGQSSDIVTVFPEAKHSFYDPAIQGKDTVPEGRFDAGYCTEMLEHIPEEEVDAVLQQMRALSGVWFMTIHTGKANQILPNGENAHCTVRPPEWWTAKVLEVFGPGVITTQNHGQPSFALIYKAST
jgi:hypothetical protein